ncbi:MAG: hypothetical protein IKU86_12760 [Thermoguttaceae bacterium]|nr:hypothetical protein [Thermoguttaceae bacterium]
MSCFRTFIALALFLGASSAFAQVGEISGKRDAPKDSLGAPQSYDITSQSNRESYGYDITYWPHDPSTSSSVLQATENGALLQAIRTEAAQMEVFPLNLIFPVKNDNGRRVGWGLRYDLTFERYLVFYRFKTAACYATPDEIEECVATFATLSPKERACPDRDLRLAKSANLFPFPARPLQLFVAISHSAARRPLRRTPNALPIFHNLSTEGTTTEGSRRDVFAFRPQG